MSIGKVSKWENELWSYMSQGDGSECPIYSHCRQRQNGILCISGHKELLDRLLYRSRFDARYYDFVGCATCGRIFELVEKLAQKLLKKGQVCCPPVPTEFISTIDERDTIEVREVSLKTHCGAVWLLDNAWIIYLNSNDPLSRKRHTLFHESFHILAHCSATPVFKRPGCEKGAFNELLANHFASCILMPGKWVTEKWAEARDFDRMVEIFDVTETAMRVRLKTLHLI